jgi:hypothetical protein
MDEMPGLKAGFGTLQVYCRKERRMDRGAMAGQTYNRTVTVVLAISMAGVLAPPLLIHKRASLLPDTVTATASLPVSLVTDTAFGHFATCANESGWITRRLFLAFCRRLRAFVGHAEPLLLMSDGHKSRMSARLVAYLKSINIHLFLIPPYTSHCLSPNDQWHQHIARERIKRLAKVPSIIRGGAASADEEICALYHAIREQSGFPNRIVAAFKAAGITREHWGVDLMRNPPVLNSTPEESPGVAAAQLHSPAGAAAAPADLDPDSTPRTKDRWISSASDHMKALGKRVHRLERSQSEIAVHQRNLVDGLTLAAATTQSKRVKVNSIHGLLEQGEGLRLLMGANSRSAEGADKERERAATRASLQLVQATLGLPGTGKGDLQEACQKLELPCTGNKPDLLQRLLVKLGLADAADASAASAGSAAVPASPSAALQVAQDDGTMPFEEEGCPTVAPDDPSLNEDWSGEAMATSSLPAGVSEAFFDCAQDADEGGYTSPATLDFWAADLPPWPPTHQVQHFPDQTEEEQFLRMSELDNDEIQRLIGACDAATRAYGDAGSARADTA